MREFEDLREELGNDVFEKVDLVHRSPSIDGNSFDPVALIRAVNRLWQLGKENALDTIERYVHIAMTHAKQRAEYGLDGQRSFLVLRILFLCNDENKDLPTLNIGSPDLSPPSNDSFWALFPLCMVRQIPFLLTGGYGHQFGGAAQSPLDHVEFCRRHCRLRESPLAPETCPLSALAWLLESDHWRRLFSNAEKRSAYERMLFHQALRALAPFLAVHASKISMPDVSGDAKVLPACQGFLGQVKRFSPVWNSKTEEFVGNAGP